MLSLAHAGYSRVLMQINLSTPVVLAFASAFLFAVGVQLQKPRAEIWAQPDWRTYIDAWIDRIVLAFLALVFATMVLGY